MITNRTRQVFLLGAKKKAEADSSTLLAVLEAAVSAKYTTVGDSVWMKSASGSGQSFSWASPVKNDLTPQQVGEVLISLLNLYDSAIDADVSGDENIYNWIKDKLKNQIPASKSYTHKFNLSF